MQSELSINCEGKTANTRIPYSHTDKSERKEQRSIEGTNFAVAAAEPGSRAVAATRSSSAGRGAGILADVPPSANGAAFSCGQSHEHMQGMGWHKHWGETEAMTGTKPLTNSGVAVCCRDQFRSCRRCSPSPCSRSHTLQWFRSGCHYSGRRSRQRQGYSLQLHAGTDEKLRTSRHHSRSTHRQTYDTIGIVSRELDR